MSFNTLRPVASFGHFFLFRSSRPAGRPARWLRSSISFFRAPQPTGHAIPDA
jgi:hypothetical protein